MTADDEMVDCKQGPQPGGLPEASLRMPIRTDPMQAIGNLRQETGETPPCSGLGPAT